MHLHKHNILMISATELKYHSLTDYLYSSDFSIKRPVFDTREVVEKEEQPSPFMRLPSEIKSIIAKNLNLSDFLSISSTSTDNYIQLRSNPMLVSGVIEKDTSFAEIFVFRDLVSRANQSNTGALVKLEYAPGIPYSVAPAIAFAEGPAQLISPLSNIHDPKKKHLNNSYDNLTHIKMGDLFNDLCRLAINLAIQGDSMGRTNVLFKYIRCNLRYDNGQLHTNGRKDPITNRTS